MKHVFITHSNITKLVCIGIIKHLSLKKEDVLILSVRKSNIEGYQNLDITPLMKRYKGKLHMPIDVNKLLRPLHLNKIYKRYKAIDNWLPIQERFILYTPHVYLDFYQIIASNKYCTQINFIEEGTLAYLETDSAIKKSNLNRFILNILYKNRVPAFDYFDVKGFNKKNQPIYYAITDLAFQNKVKKILVPFQVEKCIIPDGSNILVLDPAFERGAISERELFNSLQFFEKDVSDSKNIYVKFHPTQTKRDIAKITAWFKENEIEINIIDRDLILERELLKPRHNKLKVYGNISTLLSFAVFGNNLTKSYVKLLKNFKDKEIVDYFESIGIVTKLSQ